MVDDDPDVRAAYRAMFARSPEVELVGEVSDGSLAAAAYERYSPDVVLMDIQMPLVSGIDATREITTRWRDAVVVASTTFGAREYVVAALRAGAAGYLLKDAGVNHLTHALKQAITGEMPLSAAVRRELVSSVVEEKAAVPPQHDLAPREIELVEWLAHGLSNAQIARRKDVELVAQASRRAAVVGDRDDGRDLARHPSQCLQRGREPVPDPGGLTTSRRVERTHLVRHTTVVLGLRVAQQDEPAPAG